MTFQQDANDTYVNDQSVAKSDVRALWAAVDSVVANSGKVFTTRAAAVSAGQANLPGTLGLIFTVEGANNETLAVRSFSNTSDDPLFATAPRWGVAMRVPNVLALDGKADQSDLAAETLAREALALTVAAKADQADLTTEVQERAALDALIRADSEFVVINTAPQVGQIYNSALGQLVANANYRAMYVQVAPGDVLRLSGSVRGSGAALAAFVDEAGAVIERIQSGTTVEVVFDKQVHVAPPRAVGMWMTAENAAVVYPLAERLVPGAVGVKEDGPLSDWSNVPLDWINGGFYSLSTGALTVNANYRHAFVTVAPGEVYRLSNEINGAAIALALFLDAGGQVVYPWKRGGTPAAVFTNEVVVVPPGATRMVLGRSVNAVEPVSVERRIDQISSIPDYVQSQLAEERRVWNTIALVWASGNIRASDGAVVTNANYSHAFGDCVPGAAMRFSADLFGSGAPLVAWYGAGDVFLGSYGVGSNDAPAQFRDVELTVPAGAIRFGMTYRTADGATFTPRAEAATIAGSLTALIDSRILGSGAGGFWTGKHIVWMGTSIPAGQTTGLRYPNQVGDALGATVHNIALAGSCVRNGVASRRDVVPGDEFGWDETNWDVIGRSLSMTAAEKQDLIDNWATYRGRFRPSSNPPVTLSGTHQATFLTSSWESRMAPHLGQGRDVWVFDHGFNDAGTADDLTEGDDDTRDRGTFIGAMQYLIDLILNDNPRARIFFVGHYTDDDFVRTTLVPAQERLADIWGRPICPLYKSLGWSREREVTTTGYWDLDGNTGIWVPSGGPSQTLPLNEVWCPDGIHPDRDVSGAAVGRIAETITPWFNAAR